MKRIIFFVLISGLIIACSKEEIKIDENNLLLGTWIYSHSNVDVRVFYRVHDFTQTTGYKFNLDGSLVERNLSGFCATPPVSYSDYSGNWMFLRKDLIQISRDNYDGIPKSYNLQIQSVTIDSLNVIVN